MANLSIKNTLFVIVGILFMISHADASLSVYNAQSLGLNAAELGLQNINFSIANFGFVPFGKTMIGQLVVSPGLSDECEFKQDPQLMGEQNHFMIIPRGNCKFVPKALNAQKAGAKMVIIMDNQTYSEPFIMSDNGQGYKVKIPAIFVNHSDGQILTKSIQTAKQKGEKLIVKVSFENQKTQKVDLKFFLQSSTFFIIQDNRRSYKLVNDFQQFYQKISPLVDLKLVYQVENCSFCVKEDCYFGQEYCSYGYKKQQGATGQQIIEQEVRQMIVFQKFPQKWWGWMSYIGDECSQISELKQCSQEGMRKVGINPEQISKAYVQSFNSEGNNKYLKSCKQNLSYAGINKYPSVSINGYNMRGTISAEYLFDDICNTLSNPPGECEKYVNQTVMVTYVKQYWLLLFVVIIGGFAIFSGLFILYKRYMKKRMSSDMRNRVDDMVSKYIEFYSERAGRA